MLEIENLTKTYKNNNEAISKVNLSIKKGEFVCVLGLSGSGKSTLLRCINNLQRPSEGKVIFLNKNITSLKGKELRFLRSKIGMIFQEFNLIERKNVITNALFGSLYRTPFLPSLFDLFPPKEKKMALEILEKLGLSEKVDERVDRLSGGQKQRVAIARALMQRPSLILADEPVSSLDPKTAKGIMEYLKMINKTGVTILCSLHNTLLAKDYSSRIIGLQKGRITFDSPTSEINNEQLVKVYGKE